MDTPKFNALREQINTALAARKQTVADVARYLNKDYQQTRDWITGSHVPSGEITLRLQEWLAR